MWQQFLPRLAVVATLPAQAEILIRLKPLPERTITQQQFEEQTRQQLHQFDDLRFTFQNEMAQRDVSIIITGNDPQKLEQAAQSLKQQMRQLASVKNVQINAPLLKTELHIKLLPEEAARAGVTPQAVGQVVRIATVGDMSGTAARFDFPDRQVPIRVLLNHTDRQQLETLQHLQIPSSNGGTVALNTVASITFGQGAASLERFDRARRIAVEADLAMGFGVLMVLMVLIVLFRDFLQPFTILMALPLSIGGALIGLLLYGAALDMSSVIGILMLMGIVTKNSILLVDVVIEKRSHGEEREAALLHSGAERVRPILMTTIAMVAGMIPAVFAGGSSAAFRAPMAVAVICGLSASTLLSLVFVPVVYSLVDDFSAWLQPKLAQLTSVTAEDRQRAQE
ncbi:efflux RND transporter permease subunit [Gallibacterium melopsittaci]|uniref:Efflux RND transporter permease subunit n=1 Tax=Gallibacterium melopsittaci TaxID=516063 RepID=A0ABV6HX56_9PAST